jgi:hypothetical protein
MSREIGADPCRVKQCHPPADDSTGGASRNARPDAAAVTSPQSALTARPDTKGGRNVTCKVTPQTRGTVSYDLCPGRGFFLVQVL